MLHNFKTGQKDVLGGMDGSCVGCIMKTLYIYMHAKIRKVDLGSVGLFFYNVVF